MWGDRTRVKQTQQFAGLVFNANMVDRHDDQAAVALLVQATGAAHGTPVNYDFKNQVLSYLLSNSLQTFQKFSLPGSRTNASPLHGRVDTSASSIVK